MKLTPHLHFPGTCEEAFRTYEQVLGGRIVAMQTYGASPGAERCAPEWRTKIIHATMTLHGHHLLGADVLPEEYASPAGVNLLLALDGPEDARRVFDALADGGVVKMALQKTFWSPAFGVVVDRFGIPWAITIDS
jgi:PhnB protein